jgi:hypothetical protein
LLPQCRQGAIHLAELVIVKVNPYSGFPALRFGEPPVIARFRGCAIFAGPSGPGLKHVVGHILIEHGKPSGGGALERL